MTVESLRAGCKINLFLRITGIRADGYHTLESLFLPLDTPYDTIEISPGPGNDFSLSCSDIALVQGNIMEKAYNAFARNTGFSPGIAVRLEKGIPYGAGLGGGSSDAAALLTYLNREAEKYGAGLDMGELTTLAAGLGADVPFFLHKTPALVRGIGEAIEPVASPVSGLHLVLVCPRVHIATPWAFHAWDQKNTGKLAKENLTNRGENDTRPHVRGICVQNDLAAVVFEEYPELREIVAALHAHGASAATMSGSGSSIFGLFARERDAKNAENFFRDNGANVFRHIL